MLEKNMKQVNQLMTRIYRLCTVAILALVVLFLDRNIR